MTSAAYSGSSVLPTQRRTRPWDYTHFNIAAKKPQALSDTATALYVITREDMRRAGARQMLVLPVEKMLA